MNVFVSDVHWSQNISMFFRSEGIIRRINIGISYSIHVDLVTSASSGQCGTTFLQIVNLPERRRTTLPCRRNFNMHTRLNLEAYADVNP